MRLANVGENNLKLDVEAGAVPERIYISSKRNEEDPNVKLPTIDISNDPFQIQRGPFQSPNTSPSDTLSPEETLSGEHPPTSMVPNDTVTDDVPIQPIDDPNVCTPMDNTPLSQCEEPMVETIYEEEDVAPQARLPKMSHGEPNPDKTPRDFTLEEPLKTN